MTPREMYEALADMHRHAATVTADALFAEQACAPKDSLPQFYEQTWYAAIEAIIDAVGTVHRERGMKSPALDKHMRELAMDAFFDRFDDLNRRLAEGGRA